MSDEMSREKSETPQDSAATQPLSTASTGPTSAPNLDVSEVRGPIGMETQEHLGPVAQEPVQAPVQAPVQVPPPAWAPKPQVTYLAPPTGPNWGLVVVGLVFALVGAGVVANQVAGFEVSSLSELGPSVLVIAGLVCALLGIIGILTRRRHG
jgi:hypothetical protein